MRSLLSHNALLSCVCRTLEYGDSIRAQNPTARPESHQMLTMWQDLGSMPGCAFRRTTRLTISAHVRKKGLTLRMLAHSLKIAASAGMDEYLDILIRQPQSVVCVDRQAPCRRGQLSMDDRSRPVSHALLARRFAGLDHQHVRTPLPARAHDKLFMAATGTPSYKSLWTLDHVARCRARSSACGIYGPPTHGRCGRSRRSACHLRTLASALQVIRLFLCSDFTDGSIFMSQLLRIIWVNQRMERFDHDRTRALSHDDNFNTK
jgi:hypothetical protein